MIECNKRLNEWLTCDLRVFLYSLVSISYIIFMIWKTFRTPAFCYSLFRGPINGILITWNIKLRIINVYCLCFMRIRWYIVKIHIIFLNVRANDDLNLAFTGKFVKWASQICTRNTKHTSKSFSAQFLIASRFKYNHKLKWVFGFWFLMNCRSHCIVVCQFPSIGATHSRNGTHFYVCKICNWTTKRFVK